MKKNSSCRIAIQGNLVFQDACSKQYIKELISSNERFIELDFTGVTMLDSTGVELIAKLHTRIKEQDGVLKLLNVNSEFIEILEICGLDSLIL